MNYEREKKLLVQSTEVVRELSLVEWSVFAGIVSAVVVITLRMLA